MYCVNSTARLIAFSTYYFLYICAFVICGHGTWKTYRKIRAKNDAFMLARHPILSFSIVLMNCIDLMLIQPTHCFLFFLILSPKQYNQQYTTYLSIAILSDIRFIIFGFFFSARIWLLHFDYHFGKNCVQLLFRRKNSKKKSLAKSNNFYLNHRQTFGNPKKVIIATVILILICISILDILPLLSLDWADKASRSASSIAYLSLNDYIRIPIYCIEGIMLIILYQKVQSIDDKFKIRLEILYILCIPGVFAFIYMTFQILITLKPITNIYMLYDCDIFYIYAYFMLIIVSFTIIIKTKVVLHLHENQSQSVQHTLNLMKRNQAGKDVSFGDILGSAQGLLLFVEHLETEFSVENILFIVFIAKYREHYMSKIIPPLCANQLQHKLVLTPQKRSSGKTKTFEYHSPVALVTNNSEEEYSTTPNTNTGLNTPNNFNITPKQTTPGVDMKRFKFEENTIESNHSKEIKSLPITPRIKSIESKSKDVPQSPSPQSVSDPKPIASNNININMNKNKSKIINDIEMKDEVLNIEQIEEKLKKLKKDTTRSRRTASNISDTDVDSYLRTPVPGSFKHQPMILEEKQKELLSEEEVFSLDDIEDEIDENNEIIDNDGIEFLAYNMNTNSNVDIINNKPNYKSPINQFQSPIPITDQSPINSLLQQTDLMECKSKMDSNDIDIDVNIDRNKNTNGIIRMGIINRPITGVQEVDEDIEDDSESMHHFSDDNLHIPPAIIPSLDNQRKSKSVMDTSKKINKNKNMIRKGKHKRNWTDQTIHNIISNTIKNQEMFLTDALRLNVPGQLQSTDISISNNININIHTEKDKYDEPITPQTEIDETDIDTPHYNSDTDSEKQDLIQKQNINIIHHRPNKSKTEILSTTDTPFSGEIITPKTPNSPPLLVFDSTSNNNNQNKNTIRRTNSGRKLHDLLNGNYTSVSTIINENINTKKLRKTPPRSRNNSVDLTTGITEKQITEKRNQMNRLSILQSILPLFGDKNRHRQKSKSKSKSKSEINRKSIISMPDRSERNSIFGSSKESIKFSNRINIDIVRDSIDFDLECDISQIVNPLTQDFIPIPTSFNNVDIKEAAKHIFNKFIDDGAPYMINISHENRIKLKKLFKNEIFGTLSPLSKIFLFDATFYEIYVTIASDSFLRFKSSDKFRNFLKQGDLKNIKVKAVGCYNNKEDSQWSFNASFIDFNSSLYERTNDNPQLRMSTVQLKALPSGQPIEQFS